MFLATRDLKVTYNNFGAALARGREHHEQKVGGIA